MDGAAARRVIEQDAAIDSAQDALVARSVREISQLPERASFDIDVIFIAKNLERIADHATNIAEDVILVAEARNVKHASKLR
jgi:phosphate transport system protein